MNSISGGRTYVTAKGNYKSAPLKKTATGAVDLAKADRG
jgi:hypothetical protein